MPKVSVIVPVYNVEPYLGQCLDTILLQTLQDIEVICVDDGSTDGSLSILQTYAMFDDRLKVIHQENAGAAAARNRGLKEATGEFISVLDSDDFFEENMFEEMVAKAEEDNSDVVVCGHYIFDNSIKEASSEIKIEESYLQKSPCKPEDLGKDLFVFCDTAPWNKLIRSSLIKKHHLLFDESVRYADDQFFTCCVITTTKSISILDKSFIYYRRNVETQKTNFRKSHLDDILHTICHVYDYLNNKSFNQFLVPFFLHVKNLIYWNFPSDHIRDNLLLIPKILPKELINNLFTFLDSNIKISIIIPVYNAAEFLPECLDSCLNQTLKEIEIICVDDGSTDNSLDVLNQYAQKDSRIIVLQQKNQRQAIARNKAMEIATGKFIQFLDADDYMDPETCECLYLYSELFQLDMCQCTAVEFYNHNRKEFELPYHCLKWMPDDFPPVFNWKMYPNIIPHMAVTAWLTFYRHGFLTQNNIHWINKKIAYEDNPFFVESILKANHVGAIKEAFYHRRIHSGATTQQITTNLNEYIEILGYTLSLVKKLAPHGLLILYCLSFLGVTWSNFSKLEVNDKLKMAPFLYDFCHMLQKKYKLILPPEIHDWCVRYLDKVKKSRKEKLKFYIDNIKCHCIQNQYSLSLITWQRDPDFKITLLGIPILYTKKIFLPQTDQDIKEKVIKREVYHKLLGLTLLKVQELIYV